MLLLFEAKCILIKHHLVLNTQVAVRILHADAHLVDVAASEWSLRQLAAAEVKVTRVRESYFSLFLVGRFVVVEAVRVSLPSGYGNLYLIGLLLVFALNLLRVVGAVSHLSVCVKE